MTVYYLLVFIPFLLSIYNLIKKSESSRRWAIGSFFVFFLLILVFRDETIGCDLVNYQRDFYFLRSTNIIDTNSLLETEYGFVFFTRLITRFTDDFHVYIGIIAVISVIPFMLLYVRKSENPILTISIFLSIGVFSIFFSGMRQILAMSFIPLAYHFVIKKKKLLFLLTVTLATLFHVSAIVLFLMYPVYYMRLTKKRLLPILVALMVVFMLRKVIWVNALSTIGGRYEEMYGQLDDTGAIMLFLLTILFLLYSYITPRSELLNEEIIGLRNFLVLCVFIESFSGISNIVMRMNHYYSVFIPLLIPMVSNRCSKVNKAIVDLSVLIMVAFFILWFFYTAYNGEDIVQIFPYKTFLNI